MGVPFRSCLEINGATERSGEIWPPNIVTASASWQLTSGLQNARDEPQQPLQEHVQIHEDIYRYIKIYKNILYMICDYNIYIY